LQEMAGGGLRANDVVRDHPAETEAVQHPIEKNQRHTALAHRFKDLSRTGLLADRNQQASTCIDSRVCRWAFRCRVSCDTIMTIS
jgi:hypothetical protein